MLNKYGLGSDHKFNTYYKSEHMENTDFSSYINLNSQKPDPFVRYTTNMFISPELIFYEPEIFDNIDKYSD